MTTQPVDHERLLVHNWRVARFTRLGIPGRWPRSTPTASTGTRSPGWSSTAAPRGWPCVSPADERTREVAHTGRTSPGYLGPIVLVSLIAGEDGQPQTHAASGQRRVPCASLA